MPDDWLPDDWSVALDPAARRIDHGSVLVGGSPLRLLRLTLAGSRLVDRLAAGAAVPRSQGVQRLVRRLLDGGLAHPRPGRSSRSALDVSVVVPVRDQADPLATTLRALDGVGAVIVVDDGSANGAVEAVALAAGAEYVRHLRPQGPAAARNTGWRHATTDLVAFVDADCVPTEGWLGHLLVHFDDPLVAAVAPRITSTVPTTLPVAIARYETARPTLDRGDREAPVRPRSVVSFVPTAVLVVRHSVLAAMGDFDETMRVGEDVDFVWRLDEAGWTVRYEPKASATHAARPTAREWLRQRFDYGTSAAGLARRHGAAVAPLSVSPWSALAWALIGLGAPVSGTAVALGTTALLAPRLEHLEHPWAEAARLAGTGHLYAGAAVTDAVRRVWWPLALAAAVGSRRARCGVVAACTVPLLLEWRRVRPDLDPVRWIAMRLADDATYGAGVWYGCLKERSFAALRPDLRSWPGRRDAVEVTSP